MKYKKASLNKKAHDAELNCAQIKGEKAKKYTPTA